MWLNPGSTVAKQHLQRITEEWAIAKLAQAVTSFEEALRRGKEQKEDEYGELAIASLWRAVALEVRLLSGQVSGIVEVANFVHRLQKECPALRAALTCPYSNGPGEGNVTKLKTCLGTKAAVRERVDAFFTSLQERKEEVKHRCRSLLQAEAAALAAL